MIKKQATFLLFATALILTSCNMGATPAPTVDVNAINTAAFSTAMAQMSSAQTQTALAAPSATPLVTNTPLTLATFSTDGSAVPGAPLPTFSFNASPNTSTTPVAGLTPLASPLVPAGQAPTASMGDACSNSAFEGDITFPDGTVVDPGTNFTKIWALRNTGTCMWDDGYSLVYIGGSKPDLDPYNYNFSKKTDKDFVAGGESINIALDLTSPCTPGTYQGTWRMRNDKGYYFGTFLTVSIVVKEKRKNCGK